jgi:hypothetical protein
MVLPLWGPCDTNPSEDLWLKPRTEWKESIKVLYSVLWNSPADLFKPNNKRRLIGETVTGVSFVA